MEAEAKEAKEAREEEKEKEVLSKEQSIDVVCAVFVRPELLPLTAIIWQDENGKEWI